jgi:hypothetical protein
MEETKKIAEFEQMKKNILKQYNLKNNKTGDFEKDFNNFSEFVAKKLNLDNYIKAHYSK